VLAEFYQDYDAAFVLANEKESYEGFVECLALNFDGAYTALAARYGAFREFVLVVRDPTTFDRIGGANFIAYPLCLSGNHVLSLNLNYMFINPSARRRGYFSRMVRDLPDAVLRLLMITNPDDLPTQWQAVGGVVPPTFMFIEQNDPYRMSHEDYEQDTKYTGLDQFERIRIWGALGAKIVDFPYVQPPLTSGQEADRNLVFGVLGTPSNSLDACLLREHLKRFFGISVLKGGDLAEEPSAAEQLLSLERMCAAQQPIRLLETGGLGEASSPFQVERRPPSLRDALRG